VGHADAEALVAEQRSPGRILVVHVELDRHLAGRRHRVLDEAIAAAVLVVGEDRLVVQGVHPLVDEVDLAAEDLEHQRLGVLEQGELHLVDVGQLLAIGVDLEVEGLRSASPRSSDALPGATFHFQAPITGASTLTFWAVPILDWNNSFQVAKPSFFASSLASLLYLMWNCWK